jgi:hypothetical protein
VSGITEVLIKAIDRAGVLANKGDTIMEQQQDKVMQLSAIKNLVGTDSNIDALMLQQMQDISGTTRFYGMMNNFIEELNKAKNDDNYKGYLARYADMSNTQAFFEFVKDLQRNNFGEREAEVLNDAVGGFFMDNMQRIAGITEQLGGIQKIKSNWENSVSTMAREAGFIGPNENYMGIMMSNIAKTNARAVQENIISDLKKMSISSKETFGDTYIKNLQQRNEMENIDFKKYAGAL